MRSVENNIEESLKILRKKLIHLNTLSRKSFKGGFLKSFGSLFVKLKSLVIFIYKYVSMKELTFYLQENEKKFKKFIYFIGFVILY